MTRQAQKLLAVTMTTLMVFSVFTGTLFLSAPVAAAGNTSETTTPRFEITSVGNSEGDLTVTVTATSSTPVENFRFWYDDYDGTSAGPGEYTSGPSTDIKHAFYHDADFTTFQPGNAIATTGATDETVTFIFDSANTDFDYDSDAFRLNATAYDADYATADTGNRSVITGNYYQFSIQDNAGNPLPSGPLMFYDAETNESRGFGFVSGGSTAYDCLGVDVGGACTNPDTGATSSITDGRQTYSAPISVEAFDLSTANSSGKVDPSMGATTLTTDTPTAPTFLQLSSLTNGGPLPQADSITITNATSGNVVYQTDGLKYESAAPVFLRPNTEYTLTITNSSTFGTERRSLTLPTKGMSSARFRVATTNVDTSPVTGQIVDESGAPVSDAVVIAQPQYSGGSQVDVYNSTTTDANGLFTMALPETSQLSTNFAFRIIGTDTNGGTPIHYPTTDANGGDGYVVQSGKTVIPAMTIQEGGRVDVTVTNETGKLPVEGGFTSLSQASTAYPDIERTANSNSFSTFSFGDTLPASAAVALMSPTTGPDTQVTYNVWGQGGQSPNIQHLCAGTPSVSKGQSTDSACTLDRAGYLNISVEQYGSIIDRQSSSYAQIDGGQFSSFFFENELVIREAATGDVITYLGPDGSQQFFLGTDDNPNDISVPVPPGDYEVELRPSYDFAPTTTVNDTSTVSVTSRSTTDVTLDRGNAFEIRPSYRRSQQSFNRGADNTVAVSIRDGESMLTGSEVSAEAFLQHPNGTTASDSVALSYNSTDQTFETKSFKPSTLGVDAGRYDLAVRASYTNGDRTYNSTFSRQMQVSGFQTAIQLGSRTVAPGDTILGRIYAYDTTTDPDTAIDATPADKTTITVYDQNGRQVSQVSPSNAVTNGQGSFSVTMPDDPGRYRIAVRVQSDGGGQGIAERWVRVDKIDLEVETDRRTYSPTDTVSVDVTATDATDGSAIEDASLTLRINGQRVNTATDANGEATIRLAPKQYASNKQQWRQGYGISVTLAAETANSVVRKTAGTGFEVQAFSARARPTEEVFSAGESSVIEVQVPTSVSVTAVTATVDGGQTRIGGSLPNGKVTNPASGIYRINLGQRAIGEHIAAVTVTTQNAGSQTARTQFAVQQYAVSASLAKRTYDTGESIALDVSVRNPDGSVVTNQQVDAALNTTGPVRTVDSASASTGSDGDATLSLSSGQSGFHFIEVTVGQQTRYVGLSISSVSARLEDGNGNPVGEYNAEPGSSQTIHVNATKAGGADVADGSTVRAFISSYGDTIELGSTETTNGDASITFQIPSSVPAREYPLIVDVTTQSGSGLTTGTLNVTGANAKQITATTNESAYSPDDTARLAATVTTGDGSPIANELVDFVLESEGSADQRLATVKTDADGEAVFDYDIPSGTSNGEYVVRAALNDTSSIQAYTGYRVRSLDVSVSAADGPFEPGDTVALTVFANDSATGAPVDATSGTVELVLSGSNVQTEIDTKGTGPYQTSITLPNDGSITGTRSLSVTVQQDRATDTDSTLIEVRDSTESANLSIAEPITAGQATTVTVNGTVDTTAVLTAYSPGAGSVAYNDSVAVSSSSDTTTQLTIASPGTHIVRLSVPGVGALTQVVDVEAAGSNPVVWTQNATGVNTTRFDGSEDIHIQTNEPGMTATVLSQNATYTVELDKQNGDDHYGVLSANRADGVYLVRLDSKTATSVNDTIIEVDG